MVWCRIRGVDEAARGGKKKIVTEWRKNLFVYPFIIAVGGEKIVGFLGSMSPLFCCARLILETSSYSVNYRR